MLSRSQPDAAACCPSRGLLVLGLLAATWLCTPGCGNSAQEQQSADALKRLGALVVANPLDGTPAQTVHLGMPAVKDKLDEAMPYVAHLRRMEALTFHGAPATDSHLEHIKGLTRLHGLVLNETAVSDAGVAQLVDLDELEKLELAQTNVTEACLESVRQLASLNTINLSGTKVKGDLAPLAQMPHLEWVLLMEAEVSDEALKTLARVPKLSRLSLGGAKLNEAALEEFRRAKPQVSIDR